MTGPAKSAPITTAMVLAAGEGRRLRPLTLKTPKPLVPVGGRTLLDRGLDVLHAAGITRAVVNVSHLGGQIIDHLASRTDLDLVISDERDGLRDSAGALVHARAALGDQPVVVLNADTFWLDDGKGTDIRALVAGFDRSRMDMRLLLADQAHATGHSGSGDFVMDPDGRLTRPSAEERAHAPIYAGCAVVDMALFAEASTEPHSLNLYFDQAIAANRLHGLKMKSHWVTVGTLDALKDAEARLAAETGS